MYVIDRPQTNRGDVKEFFRNDPALKHYWPLQKNHIDYVGGNHMLLTNTVFEQGACYFNGVNASGVTTNTVDLRATDKVTVLANIRWKVYNLVSNLILVELSDTYVGKVDAFNFVIGGALAVDPIVVQLAGNAGSVSNFCNLTTNKLNDGRYHQCVAQYDKSRTTKECFYSQDGNQIIADSNIEFNNTNSFGNYVFYVGARAGTSQFSNIYMSNLALFTRILSAREIYEYYQWSNNLTNKLMVTMLDY